jgi:hypothetical protein
MVTTCESTSPTSDRRTSLTATLTRLQQERRSASLAEWVWSWARMACFIGLFIIYVSASVISAAVVVAMVLCVPMFVLAFVLHTRIRRRRINLDHQIAILTESLTRLGGRLAVIRSGSRPATPARTQDSPTRVSGSDHAGACSEPQAPARGSFHTGPEDHQSTTASEDQPVACAPGSDEPDTIATAELPAVLDDGEVWPLTDQERDDLDIHASPVGLFGLLNRCSTTLGARRLDAMLNHPCLQTDRILERQAAVRWLDEHAETRNRLMASAAGLRTHEAQLDTMVAAIHAATPLRCRWPNPRVLQWWGWLSGIVITGGIIQAGMGKPTWGVLGLTIVNLLIYIRLRPALSKFMDAWSEMGPTVAAWLELLRQGTRDLPEQGNLGVLRDRLAKACEPNVAPRLHRWLQWLNVGGAIQGIMNMLFLYDLQIAQVVLPLIVHHRRQLLDGLAASAELDALCSLACFAFEQPVCAYPELAAEETLELHAGVHPLIDPEHVQPNDAKLDETTRVWVITGSNMSGKSTFLRMTGINVLLAQIGSAVTAQRMRLCPMRLLTDLRARDNLARSESYYLAEVRQLRRMIAPPAGSGVLLGLIDEPFRGTNSEEQEAASLAVVQHLIASRQLFIVATHERRLTELGSDITAANFHFREALEGEEMVFDYQLRPGPAVSRNAIRILQREGYPADLVARAAELLARPDSQDARVGDSPSRP